MQRGNTVDAAGNYIGKFFVEVLDRVELDVFPAISRETEYSVCVAERFERVDEECDPFLFDVDNPFVRPAHAFRPARAQPDHVFDRVIRCAPVVGGFLGLVDRLGGRGRHIEQERHGNGPLVFVPAPVKPFVG